MKQIIQKKDFESYEIILPFYAITGKRRKQYLCSELEKMHPCFSDEFAFDSAVKKIGRKGVCADVVVMNKYCLAEYEDKRRFSGNGFRIDLNPERKSFLAKKRFFVDKKWRTSFLFVTLSVTACLIVAAAGIICGIKAGKKNSEAGSKSDSEMAALGYASSEKAGFLQNESAAEAPPEYVFFDAVAKDGGKVSWLEWNIEGFNQKLTASVSGVFPESFEQGVVNSVVYENGSPKMKVSYVRGAEKKKAEILISDAKAFSKNLRNTLQNANTVLIEESASPYHIEFLYKAEKNAENWSEDNRASAAGQIFQDLSQIISDVQRSVTSVSVRQTESEQLRIGLSIEAVPVNGFDLNLLSENLDLFIEREKALPAGDGKVTKTVQKTFQPADFQQKLGELKLKDNSVVIFYKNTEGKIKKEIMK